MNVSSALKAAPIPDLLGPGAPAASGIGAAGSFADAIGAAIANVESTQATAKKVGDELLFAGTGDIHNAALASQRAELSVELFQQVRNKFVSAYQEIMRMPM